jgi:hypothetical protein
VAILFFSYSLLFFISIWYQTNTHFIK